MAAIETHVLKVRSSVDGREIPYHVSAPKPLPKTPLPLVFLLHDSLADPSAGAFIEETFRAAANWNKAMADGSPGLLVQSWGRGNGAWFGAGGRALFDVWEQVQDQFVVTAKAAVIGMGAGGTGALQLAAQLPDHFCAVSAINPWVDERLELEIGAAQAPAWESDARAQIRPVDLAPRLTKPAISLARASTGDALGDVVCKRHFRAMAAALEGHELWWRDLSVRARGFGDRAELDVAAHWEFAASPRNNESSNEWRWPEFPDGLFWRPATIVVGTLGETDETEVIRHLAERMRDRWLRGEDSNGVAQGDLRLIQDVTIIEDVQAAADHPAGDLVVLGAPRLNLLAAKWANRLEVAWPNEGADDFSVLGRAFTNPRALAVVRSARPDGENGSVWVVTAPSLEGWVDVDRLRFSFLPDVFVQAKPGEELWMNREES